MDEDKNGARYAYNEQGADATALEKRLLKYLFASNECAFGLNGTIPSFNDVKSGIEWFVGSNNLVYDLNMFNPEILKRHGM